MDKTELNTRHIRPFTKHKQTDKQTNKTHKQTRQTE